MLMRTSHLFLVEASLALAAIGCSAPGAPGDSGTDAGPASLGSDGALHDLALVPGLEITARVTDGTKVSVTTQEVSPISGSTIETRREFSTSFAVNDLTSTGSHRLFLAGVGPRGDDVIEAWRLPKDPGSYQFQVLASPQRSVFEPPWTAPIDRPAPRAPARSTVFQGDLGEGSILEIVADPEERFLLAFLGEEDPTGLVPNTIHKIDLVSGSTELLWSSETDLFMQAPLDDFKAFDHADLGRVYRMNTLGGLFFHVLFIDADNDGTFESAEGFTFDDVEAAGWLSPSKWTLLSS